MKTVLMILIALTAPSALAASVDYDCEIRGSSNYKAKVELTWNGGSHIPFKGTEVGEGFLTIYTDSSPLLDIITVSLPKMSKSGSLQGSRFSAHLREPFSVWSFGGWFFGLPGESNAFIHCSYPGQ